MLNELDAKMLAWATDKFGMVSTDERGRVDLNGLNHEQRQAYQQQELHFCTLDYIETLKDQKRRKSDALVAMLNGGDRS